MILYLFRHGIAADAEQEGSSDFDRPLTSVGRRKARAAIRGLRRLGCKPDRIVSSPLPRAWETAEIAAAELQCRGQIVSSDLLKPGVAVGKVVKWVGEQDRQSSVMLVGHMPGLARLASHLLANDDRVEIVLKKCAVCELSRDDDSPASPYRLEWLLQPRQLRAVGGSAR